MYFSVVLSVLVSVFFSFSPVWAQEEDIPHFRQLTTQQMKRFVDNNTFFKQFNIDRVYFGPDGELIQQLNSGWNEVPVGTIYKGTWTLNERILCWRYDAETMQKHNIADTDFCYGVYTSAPDETFMTLHTEEFILFRVENGVQTQEVAFEWNRWAYDNYILEPEFVPEILEAMPVMRGYRNSYGIPDGTINRENLNERMKKYYDEVIGQIFFIDEHLMYMHENGEYYYITESMIEELGENSEQLTHPERFGKWQMKDNIHCYTRTAIRGQCEFVAPEGRGLIRDYEGILGFHNNGFSRVHGEMAVGHMHPEDSSYPELFERVDAIIEERAH